MRAYAVELSVTLRAEIEAEGIMNLSRLMLSLEKGVWEVLFVQMVEVVDISEGNWPGRGWSSPKVLFVLDVPH